MDRPAPSSLEPEQCYIGVFWGAVCLGSCGVAYVCRSVVNTPPPHQRTHAERACARTRYRPKPPTSGDSRDYAPSTILLLRATTDQSKKPTKDPMTLVARPGEHLIAIIHGSGSADIEDVDNVTKEFTKRGWKVLKRQLAKPEDSSQDLYERYGVVPTTLPDSMIARLDVENVQKRSNSYQPPALQIRNQMQKEYEQCPCNKATGCIVPQKGKYEYRQRKDIAKTK
ncbi:hypothetical protein DPMN_192712 [Dreissena polymorpha]|uniref:Uncharacterized protein n=1 Tax=Dreissena polymorpha TaxID=45954 RepID=A0A9D3Y3Z1_DREPO|nr:hypothetical protein DPMN_192712 [Dreissena polymorpha]